MFAEYKTHRKGARLTSNGRDSIRAAIKDFGAPDEDEPRDGWEVCRDVVRWAFTSTHSRAQFIRQGEHTSLKSLLQARTREERRLFSSEAHKAPARRSIRDVGIEGGDMSRFDNIKATTDAF